VLAGVLAFLLLAPSAFALGDGTLQLHFMDVGQGDGAVLISPQGETVLFDDGVRGNCDGPLLYLRQLHIDHIDYHFASHYHADHIGCAGEVLHEFPLTGRAFDRGGSYESKTYGAYVEAVGAHRETATAHTVIVLDSTSASPVAIDVVALNGDTVSTTNENDLSLVAVVHYAEFAAEFGGDLSGMKSENYEDIESDVAPKVGPLDVYKVHHHGSRYSSNDAWLHLTHPQVAVLSEGSDNRYGHPTAECLQRLHRVVRRVYWTEAGAGVAPDPAFDVVGGNIVVHVFGDRCMFTVTCAATADTFSIGGGRVRFGLDPRMSDPASPFELPTTSQMDSLSGSKR
jgi:beta-lactamase superfamily II metal-dependent hydrolase